MRPSTTSGSSTSKADQRGHHLHALTKPARVIFAYARSGSCGFLAYWCFFKGQRFTATSTLPARAARSSASRTTAFAAHRAFACSERHPVSQWKLASKSACQEMSLAFFRGTFLGSDVHNYIGDDGSDLTIAWEPQWQRVRSSLGHVVHLISSRATKIASHFVSERGHQSSSPTPFPRALSAPVKR